MYTGVLVLFVTLHSISQISGAKAKHGPDDKIFYPGPVKESNLNTRYDDSDSKEPEEIHESCKNKNYCTIKPSNYPQKKFDNMFEDRIPLTPPVLDGLEDKQGDPDEVDNCESLVEFEPLYKVKAQNGGDWRTVVQSSSKNFVQVVRMETCRAANTPCFTVFPKLPAYTTFCKQKYTTWHFVVEADSGEPNKTETIPVDLPTCCSCHYRPT